MCITCRARPGLCVEKDSEAVFDRGEASFHYWGAVAYLKSGLMLPFISKDTEAQRLKPFA